MKSAQLLPLLLSLFMLASCNNSSEEQNQETDQNDITSGTFSKQLSFKDITFDIEATNKAKAINVLTIQASGFEQGIQSAEHKYNGKVVHAELKNMDSDDWPELFVFIEKDLPGKYGGVIVYSIIDGKSMSEVPVPDVVNETIYGSGFRGQNEYALVQTFLMQMFPNHKAGDKTGEATGGMQQLQYKIEAGRFGKSFELVSASK